MVFSVQDTISLRGEVFFPNLQFDKTTVDFGCILNDTEVTRYVHVVNTSPMEVSYHWSFVLSDQPVAVFHQPPDLVESDVVLEDLDNVDTELRAEGEHVGVPSETVPAIEVDIAVEGVTTSPTDVPKPAMLCEVCNTLLYFVRSLLSAGVQPTLDPKVEAFCMQAQCASPAQEGRRIGWLVCVCECMRDM